MSLKAFFQRVGEEDDNPLRKEEEVEKTDDGRGGSERVSCLPALTTAPSRALTVCGVRVGGDIVEQSNLHVDIKVAH